LQRINVTKSIRLDPIEESLCLRYAEILALRKAIQKESSTLASKKPKPSETKRMHVLVKCS